MRYPLEKLPGCFFKSEFFTASDYLEHVAFQIFDMDMFFFSKGASFTQRKVEKIVFHSQQLLRTKEYHPNNYIFEYLSHSRGTPLKNCLDAAFK